MDRRRPGRVRVRARIPRLAGSGRPSRRAGAGSSSCRSRGTGGIHVSMLWPPESLFRGRHDPPQTRSGRRSYSHRAELFNAARVVHARICFFRSRGNRAWFRHPCSCLVAARWVITHAWSWPPLVLPPLTRTRSHPASCVACSFLVPASQTRCWTWWNSPGAQRSGFFLAFVCAADPDAAVFAPRFMRRRAPPPAVLPFTTPTRFRVINLVLQRNLA